MSYSKVHNGGKKESNPGEIHEGPPRAFNGVVQNGLNSTTRAILQRNFQVGAFESEKNSVTKSILLTDVSDDRWCLRSIHR